MSQTLIEYEVLLPVIATAQVRVMACGQREAVREALEQITREAPSDLEYERPYYPEIEQNCAHVRRVRPPSDVSYAAWSPAMISALGHIMKSGDLRGKRICDAIKTDDGLMLVSSLWSMPGLDGEDREALDLVLTDRIVAGRIDRLSRHLGGTSQ